MAAVSRALDYLATVTLASTDMPGDIHLDRLTGIIQDDFDGHPLDHLHEIACGVLRRQEREHRPGAALQAVDVALQPDDAG